MPKIIDKAPIPIAHAPVPVAPRLRAIKPTIIPAAPNMTGKMNNEIMDRARARKPIPLPSPTASPRSASVLTVAFVRPILIGAAISAADSVS